MYSTYTLYSTVNSVLCLMLATYRTVVFDGKSAHVVSILRRKAYKDPLNFVTVLNKSSIFTVS